MASNYSPELRIQLMQTGEKSGQWGDITNVNWELIESAISGSVNLSVTAGNNILTYADGSADESRCAILNITNAAGVFVLLAPPVTKTYIIKNNTGIAGSIYCSTVIGGNTYAGAGYSIPENSTVFIHSDGTTFYDAVNHISGPLKLDVALGSNYGGTGYGTGASPYVAGDLLYANSTSSLAKIAISGSANRVLRSNGTTPSWGQVALTTDVTGVLPIANGGTNLSSTNAYAFLVSTTANTLSSVAVAAGQSLKLNSGGSAWEAYTPSTGVGFTGTLPVANQVVTYADTTGNAITTGYIYEFKATSAGQAQLRLYEDADSAGGNYVAIQPPASLAANYTLTLPVDDGTSGQILSTDGTGVLSWTSASTGNVSGPGSSTTNAIPTFSDTTGKVLQNNSGVTISAGTITATGFSGSGASLSSLNGSQITTGTVAAARLDLSNLNGSNITTGTVAATRLDLSNLNGSNITTGTVSALRLPVADISNAGIVSTTTQTFAGVKTFNNSVNVNGIVSTTGAYNFTSLNESIYGSSGSVSVSVGGAGRTTVTTAAYTPFTDGLITLGTGSVRWGQIFSTSGTINTSDANSKQDIADLDEAEKRVAVRIKGLIKKFRFKDAVAEKGAEARIHVGVIAQEVQMAFSAEGLDANRYGMFCSDTWWEREEEVEYKPAAEMRKKVVVYDTPVEGGIQKTRLGVRYDELLAFVIAAM